MTLLQPNFQVNAEPDRAWAFLRDVANLGGCIPDCQVADLDGTRSTWTFTAQVGFIKKVVKLNCTVGKRDEEARRIEFTGSGAELDIVGFGRVSAGEGGAGSNVQVQLRITAKGLGAGPLGAAIDMGAADVQRQFIRNVQNALA